MTPYYVLAGVFVAAALAAAALAAFARSRRTPKFDAVSQAVLTRLRATARDSL
jgi:hypothetical protein